ncbi:MAG: DUF4124 domain-containing protein [Proteobacteria bacterium]|nr:DUF4124 domain-containing protein [Pseudomonadota bacterium]
MKVVAVFFFGMLLAGTVTAAVYKCTGADGKIEFGDKPCAGADSEAVALQYNTIDMASGEPNSAKAAKKKSVRKAAADAKQTPDASKASGKNASRSAKTSVSSKNVEKANERRFIREGMTTAEVRSRIGSPDSQEAGVCRERTKVNSKNQVKTVRDLCEKCWVYDPADGDPQTLTRVCFQNSQVSSIERKVVR